MKHCPLVRFFLFSGAFLLSSTLRAHDASEAVLTFSAATEYRAFNIDLWAALDIDPNDLNISGTHDDACVIVFDETDQFQLDWIETNYPLSKYDRYSVQSLSNPKKLLDSSKIRSLPAKISYREGKLFIEEFPVALDLLQMKKITCLRGESAQKEEIEQLFTLPNNRHVKESFIGEMPKGQEYSSFSLSTDLNETVEIEAVFFDGREPQQLYWAAVNHPQSAWGIVKGSPRAIKRVTGHPVIVCDEEELYTTFGLETLPAKVAIKKEEGAYRVFVEQFALGEETAEHKQAGEDLKPTLYEYALEAWFD